MKKKWLLITMLLAGCSTSQISSSWKNNSVAAQKFDPVVIIGVMNDADSVLCRVMEERFAANMNAFGYNAVSSIAVYGPKAFDRLTEEETFKTIYNKGIGAVITIELLDKRKETFSQPSGIENNFQPDFRPYVSQKPSLNNYFLVHTNYIWESNYYDMNGFLLLYSVNSKTYEGTDKKMAKEYVTMVIADMTKKGLLQKQVIALKAF